MLRRALRGPCRLPPGSRLMVAVSGGADSTALLLGLHRLARELDLSLSAAHLDHGLRGEASAQDRAAVRRLCRELGVPLLDARWDTRRRMRRRGLSGHAGLRRLRREFLRRAAARAGAAAIATAHHADDQLETLLARLLRGAGLAGLGGMRPRRGIWLKPLLGISRREIELDLRRAGVPWREDPSNRDPRYLRSRLRQQAVPALVAAAGAAEAAAPAARAALARRVSRSLVELRQARRLVERLARDLMAGRARGRILDLAPLAGAPPVVRRAALRLAWRRAGAPAGLTAPHLDALLVLCGPGRRAGRVSLPRGWGALRRQDILQFVAPADVPARSPQAVAGVATSLRRRGRAAAGTPDASKRTKARSPIGRP